MIKATVQGVVFELDALDFHRLLALSQTAASVINNQHTKPRTGCGCNKHSEQPGKDKPQTAVARAKATPKAPQLPPRRVPQPMPLPETEQLSLGEVDRSKRQYPTRRSNQPRPFISENCK
jgi:hypothetical protein